MLHAMIKRFRSLSIRSKIIVVFLPLIILPLIIFGICISSILTNEAVNITNRSIIDNSSLIINNIEVILNNIDSCSKTMVLSVNRIYARVELEKDPSLVILPQYWNSDFTFASVLFPQVESITFMDQMGNIISTSLQQDMESEEIRQRSGEFIQFFTDDGSKQLWLPVRKRNFLQNEYFSPTLSLVRRVDNLDKGTRLGYVAISLKEDTLASVYKNIGVKTKGIFVITDENGMIISSNDKSQIFKTLKDIGLKNFRQNGVNSSSIADFQEGQVLVVTNAFTNMKWTLVSITPLNELTTENSKIVNLVLILLSVCTIVFILGSVIISRFIANPIIKLTKYIQKNQDIEVEEIGIHNTSDEVGVLMDSFTKMVNRNKKLYKNIECEQRKKREYELALMQLQIKPHFLYNTLDVIYRLAGMNRNADVCKATKALADFYRLALSKGNEIIKVREELSNAEKYLSIQEIRYSNVFCYQMDIQDNIKDCSIPKLTLQPLLENAIYHGLKELGQKGTISLFGYQEGDLVIIKVMDNGIGMTEEKLSDILKEDLLKTSFGLRNLDERIKLYFGKQYGLKITSGKNVGTEVTIMIPYDVQSKGE